MGRLPSTTLVGLRMASAMGVGNVFLRICRTGPNANATCSADGWLCGQGRRVVRTMLGIGHNHKLFKWGVGGARVCMGSEWWNILSKWTFNLRLQCWQGCFGFGFGFPSCWWITSIWGDVLWNIPVRTSPSWAQDCRIRWSEGFTHHNSGSVSNLIILALW